MYAIELACEVRLFPISECCLGTAPIGCKAVSSTASALYLQGEPPSTALLQALFSQTGIARAL